MMETHTPEDVFISYCTQNADKANLLLEALEELGLRCWIAPRNIVGGDTWPVAITKALQHCKIMVLVYSSASQDSVYVVNEATIALRLNKYIVPVRTEDIPVQKSLDLLLATCQWKDAFRDPAAESREIAKEIYITLKRILNEPHDDEVLRKYNAKRSGKGRKVLLGRFYRTRLPFQFSCTQYERGRAATLPRGQGPARVVRKTGHSRAPSCVAHDV